MAWRIACAALALAACHPSAPSGYRIYVSNEADGTVTVIDGAARATIATIPVGQRPRGLHVSRDHRFLYIALSGSPRGGPGVDESKLPAPDRAADGIGVVDLRTLRLVRTIALGHTHVAAQVAYGHGITDDERFGDVRLSALHPVAHGLSAGLDARATLDLEIDNSEPPGEEEWNLRAGPAATLALGPVTAGALVGASAVKLRAEAAGRAGAVAEVGLTARF